MIIVWGKSYLTMQMPDGKIWAVEKDENTLYDFNSMIELSKDLPQWWRIPSKSDFEELINSEKNNKKWNGMLWNKLHWLVSSLPGFRQAGEDNISNVNEWIRFWTSDEDENNKAFYYELRKNSICIYSHTKDKQHWMSVVFVKH